MESSEISVPHGEPQGVVEQFRTMYPNAKLNIVSGKIGYNGDTAGKKTWTHRKKVK